MMAKVTGIGGVFLRAKDPKALQQWYQDHLGMPVDAQGYNVFIWRDNSDDVRPGSTVWAAFPDETEYFGTDAPYMVNYRVDDLDAMRAQLKEAGAKVDDAIEEMDGVGRFGWATDPEGNRFELWEPAEGC